MSKAIITILVIFSSLIFSKDIYVSFVLDETGSMEDIKTKTINGFNEYMDMLQSKDQNVLMTLTKFNSERISVEYQDVNVNYLCGLNNKTYQPDNMTPLYDAIGITIDKFREVDNMLFVILTDGLENYSKEYSQKTIYNMIAGKKEEGWTFVFLGADQDKYAAESIGINEGFILNFNSDDIDVGIGVVTDCSSSYIDNIDSIEVDSDFQFFLGK